jgi:DNA-binding SARP family transcriptional activator
MAGDVSGSLLTIRLLGRPALERDGAPVRSPRGRKAWAVLAYLLLAERPPTRSHLAELLFGEADDPLGAVRWTLAELRRVLGARDSLRGDPVSLVPTEDVWVDVLHLDGPDQHDLDLLRTSGVLLDGADIASAPSYESWLVVERHRVAGRIEARLRQSAIALMAHGQPAESMPYTSRLVALNPLDEANHELLLRSLAMSGDRRSVQRQLAISEDLLRRELGLASFPSLREAASAESGAGTSPLVGGRAAALSQLEAGRAAIVAGAVDAGVQTLRRAVNEAGRLRDEELQGRTLTALGSALVHATRGRDEEGTLVLHSAIDFATRAGDTATVVTALGELGFIDVQAGRRRTAEAWLSQAEALAESDEQLSTVMGIRGMNASDRGDYPTAFEQLGSSVELAARSGDQRQQAWSLSLVGRAHVLRGERRQAELALEESLDLVAREHWMAFLPWPQALRAELELLDGDPGTASESFERAWALATQLGDPCWEGMAARGLGLLHARRGDRVTADRWLTEATMRSTRLPDRYQWVHAHVLDARITTAIEDGRPDRAEPLVDALETLAGRCEMGELVVRALVHRHDLGDANALAAARLLGADIDNPALSELVGSRS